MESKAKKQQPPRVSRWASARPADVPTSNVPHPRSFRGFLHIYGWLGVPIVLVLVLSAVWTLLLALIQYAPNGVTNYLMSTQELDAGEFWLLPSADEGIAISAIVALTLFAAGYMGLVVLMLFPDKLLGRHIKRGRTRTWWLSVKQWLLQMKRRVKVSDIQTVSVEPAVSLRTSSALLNRFTRSRSFTLLGRVRSQAALHPDSPLLTLPKLALQTTTLFTYLQEGFPMAIIFSFSWLLFTNWTISFVRFQQGQQSDRHLVIRHFSYSFDLFFAVFAPLQVLLYAYYNFAFDREVFATRVDAFKRVTFDRTARLFVDPTEVSLFRLAFQHLQFTTPESLLIKCVLNVFTILKGRLVIIQLVERAAASRAAPTTSTPQNEKQDPVRNRKNPVRLITRQLLACTFLGAGVWFLVYSVVAVVSSRNVCQPYVQCKVPSYRWNVGATHCSCVVFVDRTINITTMAEWENPIDTTANLAALAHTGHLKIVQIINRQLPTLPEELRSCKSLKQLILVYTKIRSLPDWTKEFSKLEYLHLEGDLTAKQLTYAPRDLFVHMDHLRFIHVGSLIKLPFVPELNSLVRLEYLVLAMLHSVTEIPPIGKLVNLKRLNYIDLIQVTKLPPMGSLSQLTAFAIALRTPVCCNGFLSGVCNLSAFACVDRAGQGERRIRCTMERMSPQDHAILQATEGNVCPQGQVLDMKDLVPSRATIDVACGGVLYKQCEVSGRPGMCFPGRMQPISCQVEVEYATMRRFQITRGVGDVCDPRVERWLGCR